VTLCSLSFAKNKPKTNRTEIALRQHAPLIHLLTAIQTVLAVLLHMAEQPPDYYELYLREQRAREAAESAQEAAESAQEAAERAQREEQRRREIAEDRTRRTTLPEFLDACYSHLHLGLSI
jgi:septal ring factor EnvC (AmiA/AmiB activator)